MIRLQFVCQDVFSSKAIAWFSSGHFSHVDCLLDDDRLLGARFDKVGDRPSGVHIRPPDYADFSTRVIFSIPATTVQRAVYETFLRGQVGKPYDSRAIWGFMFNRDWRERDSWICSELQAAALERAGLTPRLYLAANKITPVALALVVSSLGATWACMPPTHTNRKLP